MSKPAIGKLPKRPPEDTSDIGNRPLPASPLYQVEDQIGLLIRRVHQRATGIFNEHFRDYRLSPLQFTALVKIRDEGRVSQNQLARLVFTDPATIMGVIKRLDARDLIRRLPDPNDRRITLLTITSIGLRLVEECERVGFEVSDITLAPLDSAEREVLLRLLSRLM